MKNLLFIILLVSPLVAFSQGGMIIENGANLITTGTSSIVVNDINLQIDGNFEPSIGTVIMAGSGGAATPAIQGLPFLGFYNLRISNPGGQVLLGTNIGVEQDLVMDQGILDLNGNDLGLTGAIVGESESSRITGTSGGEIVKNVTLNMPVEENPGNMGITITSTQNLGDTWVVRGHTPMTVNGSQSIDRYFEIIPANNASLDATVRVRYFTSELQLGLHDENLLQQWHGQSNAWTPFTTTQSNLAENWIETNGVNEFAFITLAHDIAPPLPIELLSFDARVNDQKEVELTWITENEINNEFFTVERSQNAENFEEVLTVEGAGNSNIPINYFAIDREPYQNTSYYRLKQTDFDGSYSYSEIRAVHIAGESGFSVYPNPFTSEIEVAGQHPGKETITIELINAIGQTLYSQKINDENHIQHSIANLDQLASGNYVLMVNTGSDSHVFKVLKAE